jgi:tripartite-type tricarboxylate transporter receptor subunit TctC
MRKACTILVVAVTVVAVRAVGAQEAYPARPIRLVVASSAGGVHDVIGRLWADKVKSALGSIIIDNRGGAGGSIGVSEVARAAPDGHTLLLGSNSTHILHPMVAKWPGYDPIRDFAAACIFATTWSAIAVHPAAPARSLRELIDYARASPGKLAYAHGGTGGTSHVAGEMFKQRAGNLDIIPVPYKGTGPAQADVISGTVPMFVASITSQVLELNRTGRIRILAVNAETRHHALPDVPTAIEAGVPDMVSQNFFGVFAPARTSATIVERLNALTQEALADREFARRLSEAGFEPVADLGTGKAQDFVKAEYARWEPIVKASGARID